MTKPIGAPPIEQPLGIIHVDIWVIDVDSYYGDHQGLQFSSLGGKPVNLPWLLGSPSSIAVRADGCRPAREARRGIVEVREKVGLSVKGKGLSVNRASGWMDGHVTGVEARLYTVYKGGRSNITDWKDTTPVSPAMTQFSNVDWNLKGRTFPNGNWLCIEFDHTDDSPCAKIHR